MQYRSASAKILKFQNIIGNRLKIILTKVSSKISLFCQDSFKKVSISQLQDKKDVADSCVLCHRLVPL